jgi:hypothetical protein
MMKLPNSVPLPPARKRIDPDALAAADGFVARGAEQETAALPKPAAPPSPEPTKRLTLDLPISLHRKFKKKAVDHDKTMMQFLIEAVEAWTRED